MSTNTYNEALELAYAEAWRLGGVADRYESGESKVAGGAEAQKRETERMWREALGGQRVLGALLFARGEVGHMGYPGDPETFVPDIQQIWIRLMQWAIAKGYTTQDKLDEVVESYPQYVTAMEHLGEDIEHTDFRALIDAQDSRS